MICLMLDGREFQSSGPITAKEDLAKEGHLNLGTDKWFVWLDLRQYLVLFVIVRLCVIYEGA